MATISPLASALNGCLKLRWPRRSCVSRSRTRREYRDLSRSTTCSSRLGGVVRMSKELHQYGTTRLGGCGASVELTPRSKCWRQPRRMAAYWLQSLAASVAQRIAVLIERPSSSARIGALRAYSARSRAGPAPASSAGSRVAATRSGSRCASSRSTRTPATRTPSPRRDCCPTPSWWSITSTS